MSNHDMEALKNELSNLSEPPAPVRARLTTNNATVEKIHELCRDNPRGVLVVRDELAGWTAQIDQAGHEQDRAFYLEGWNGTGRFDLDRIGRGTITAKTVCLSVLGGIQPDKLRDYLTRGYENDGLIQRFQANAYADEKPYKHVDRPPNDRARARAQAVITALHCIQDYRNAGATGGDGEIPGARLSADAQSVFNQWLTDLETRIQTSKDHPLILEHLSKFRSFVPALALINHLVRKADAQDKNMGEVCREDLAMAIAQAEYFESHARRMYGLVLGGLTASSKLASRILSGDLEDGFTARDVYRNGWSSLNSIEAVEEACKVLVGKKWLKTERTTGNASGLGGRPTTVYRINPKVYRWADMPND